MKRLHWIIQAGTWILIAAWFSVTMGFVSDQSDKVLCRNIDVVFSDTARNHFVTREEIREMLEASSEELQGYPLREINTWFLEEMLEKNPYVRNAEVSKDISGTLQVFIEQRDPLIRIMPGGREGFYLDREGTVMPLSERFTPLIILATGNIPSPGESRTVEGRLEEIYRFARYLDSHPFWNDQIVQIYVNEKTEYELIPRVGAHHILLGEMEQWQKKLKNLELLYRQGFSRYGWNTYEQINLKYSNQVICTKR
ncbi:MAG: hypothetical protein R6U78_17235 [Bacteroidales bacterium]